MTLIPIDLMRRRLDTDRQDSDVALFLALLYYGESVVKLLTTSVVAAIRNDHYRYRQEYNLVRANGLGDWHTALAETVNGPSSQYLTSSIIPHRKEINQKCPETTWQFEAVKQLDEALKQLGVNSRQLQRRSSCLEWVEMFAILRNKTRGHGAQPSSHLAELCQLVESSIDLIVNNCSILKTPWAYLRQNLSGKYRVTALGGDQEPFQFLKSSKDISLEDGVYVFYDEPTCLKLLVSDPEASDFFFPNGSFSDTNYEVISYISGETQNIDSHSFLRPREIYPTSETEGLGTLDVVGNSFTNLPPVQTEYIERTALEVELTEQLVIDHHPIVSLAGLGGIGKTSVALQVVHQLIRKTDPRFDVVLWFSARDIDLLLQGPRPVTPRGVNLRDFAKQCVELLEPPGRSQRGFDAIQFFADQLKDSSHGSILFIFDNFETVESPKELYTWIDSYIRSPNKVLITTRIRKEFDADYPVRVGGMTRLECEQLIESMSMSLKIEGVVDSGYRESIISESEGHPYVIKVLLGEAARIKTKRKVERIIADSNEILVALFERIYAALTPAAQRTFLTLSKWRSMVPEIAIQAVMLRPTNERIPVEDVIDELLQSSLVQSIKSESGDMFLDVPLSAMLFANRKLVASPWKASVESDAALLKEFGASQRSGASRGVAPIIDRFFKNVARSISKGERSLDSVVPMLKYVCDQHKESWTLLADLHQQEGGSDSASEIKYCLQRYLEAASVGQPADLSWTWRRLADVCRDSNDVDGEIHAIGEMARVPGLQLNVLTSAAKRISQRLSELSPEAKGHVSADVKERSLQILAEQLDARKSELDAMGCSRLAWLYVYLGRDDEAKKIVQRGLDVDPSDYHCTRLLEWLVKP